jgi:hypothetical protein
MIQRSQQRVQELITTLTALGVSTTSYALDQGLTWPYVTLPHFGHRGVPIVASSQAKFLALSPLVTEAERFTWESWSVEQPQFQSQPGKSAGTSSSSTISTYLYQFENDTTTSTTVRPLLEVQGTTGPGYYAPLWQFSMAPSTSTTTTATNRMMIKNLDLFTYAPTGNSLLANVYSSIVTSSQSSSSSSSSLALSFLELNANPDPNDNATWPYTYLATPVWRTFGGPATTTMELVALYNVLVPWHAFLENKVTDDDLNGNGLVVVVKNTCHQVVTYQVNGQQVTFSGDGDFHDTSLNDYEVFASFEVGGLLASHVNNDEEPLQRCDYTLHVYPTSAFYESFHTKKPWYYAGAVVILFLVTSLVFSRYDSNVQKRQKLVLSSAERSNAIVSSLFPAQVRDRMMNPNPANDDYDNYQNNHSMDDDPPSSNTFTVGGGSMSKKTKRRESATLSALLGGGGGGGGSDNNVLARTSFNLSGDAAGQNSTNNYGLDDPSGIITNSKPIADLFPCASVMFADICGFTAWSSARDPTQVREKTHGSILAQDGGNVGGRTGMLTQAGH